MCKLQATYLACKAKVGELDDAVLEQEDVLQLQVSVADAQTVEMVDAAHQLSHPFEGLRFGYGTVLLHVCKLRNMSVTPVRVTFSPCRHDPPTP